MIAPHNTAHFAKLDRRGFYGAAYSAEQKQADYRHFSAVLVARCSAPFRDQAPYEAVHRAASLYADAMEAEFNRCYAGSRPEYGDKCVGPYSPHGVAPPGFDLIEVEAF